jgi:hypothetical protein
MVNPPIDWLLEGDPWVAYRTRIDLLGEPGDAPSVRTSRQAMIAAPPIQGLIGELAGWPGAVLASHKSASQPYHKLTFLADLGLKAEDPGMAVIVARVMERQSSEGPFQLPMTISAAHGGTGQEQWAWALCDAPLTVYALARLGLADDPRVRAAMAHLAGLVRENGWPCAVSKELGSWRGPGRKDDPCPYANLAMLKAASSFPEWRDSPASHTGAETLLTLWRESLERHPYIFYMGTDFRKLKAPLVWYDILHVLDVLSLFPWLRHDERLRDMLGVLRGKVDDQGRFTPESVWSAWKDWEFGQKRAPSRWVTFLAWRIISRMERAQETED